MTAQDVSSTWMDYWRVVTAGKSAQNVWFERKKQYEIVRFVFSYQCWNLHVYAGNAREEGVKIYVPYVPQGRFDLEIRRLGILDHIFLPPGWSKPPAGLAELRDKYKVKTDRHTQLKAMLSDPEFSSALVESGLDRLEIKKEISSKKAGRVSKAGDGFPARLDVLIVSLSGVPYQPSEVRRLCEFTCRVLEELYRFNVAGRLDPNYIIDEFVVQDRN